MFKNFFCRVVVASLLLLPAVPVANAQVIMAQQNLNSFGKNRMQFRQFQWQYYQTPNFTIYYYQGGKEMALRTAEYAEAELQRIAELIGYYPYSRIVFMLYNSPSDRLQSNIGLTNYQFYNSSEGLFVTSKVELAFPGTQTEWKKQVSYSLAEMLLSDMMYGGSLKEVLQSSYLLQLPDWYIAGAAAYLAEGWVLEADDYMRDIIAHTDRNKTAKLLSKDPRLAGQAIWSFIGEHYGVDQVQNILNLTRITRDAEIGVSNSLNMSFKTFLRNWSNFYEGANSPVVTQLALPDASRQISKNRGADQVCSEVHISPSGNKISFVSNELGRYLLRVHDVRTGKTQTLLRGGYKNNQQSPDYQIPQVAWKSDEVLSVILSKRGNLVLRNYSASGKMLSEMLLQDITLAGGMQYAADGTNLVMSLVKNGQRDLFLLKQGARSLQQLTNDLFDDSDPSFYGKTGKIVFSSNRPTDSLTSDKGNFATLADNYDIFLLTPGAAKPFKQLTNSVANEHMPLSGPDGDIYYLSEESGIRAINKINPISVTSSQQSNMITSIHSFSINANGSMAMITTRNGAQGVYFYPAMPASAPMLKTARQRTLESRLFPVQTSDTLTPAPPATPDSVKQNTGKEVDINNYTFEGDQNTGNTKAPEVSRIKITIGNPEKQGPLVITGPRKYQPRIGVTNFISNFFRIDPFLGLGLVMEVGMKDVFEDHRFNAGAFVLVDFRSTHFYGEYSYLKNLIDYKIGFDKKSIFYSFESRLIARFSKQEIQGSISYPLSYTTSIRALPRFATTRFTAINAFTLPDIVTPFAGMGAELVYDNSLPTGINMMTGSRAKAGIASYYGLGKRFENFAKLYIDVRHYQKLHKQLVWANRVTFGQSIGPAAKRYLLGGMDNWVANSVEDTVGINWVDHPGEIFFTEYATPLRGFGYAARKGHKYLLFNSELRLPIFQYLANGPVYSNFLRNLQLQLFTDIGTAYDGLNPFNSNNSFNRHVIGGNGNAFTATVTNYRNPFLIGYGAGIRTTIAGFYGKLDLAWGQRDYQTTKPKLYITMGYDF